MDSAYQIVPYQPELRDGVVRVLSHLLGDDEAANRAYFQWKYEENPFRSAPPGVVAIRDGVVVAFRGYFATRWAVTGGESFTVLCPGDTCVDPQHQRRGLSVEMGKAALGICMTGARLLVNMSATSKSVPGYVKLGFAPVVAKTYLHRCSWMSLSRFVVASRFGIKSSPRRVRFGQFGDVLVADAPDPAVMARVAAAGRPHRRAMALAPDETFFAWRFRNRRHRYVFYFLRDSGTVTSYVVIRFAPGARRGFIVDYAASANGALERLLPFVARAGHADVLSVWSCGMDPAMRDLFGRIGFSSGLLSAVEHRLCGQWPILVRPVGAKLAETDWVVDGLDVRDTGNWHLREIASDWV